MSALIADAKAAAERLNDGEVVGKMAMAEIQAVLDKYEMDLIWMENKVNGQLRQAGIGIAPRPPRIPPNGKRQ